MIIKDLWIIGNSGVCLYHYHALFSDYEIDQKLFSGFVAALSLFSTSLAGKNIDFLKMKDDEMYFVSFANIIIISIMNTSGGEQYVIKQILNYIGEKFLEEREKFPEQSNFPEESLI
ncbi:MAG: hypothetical protein ACFFBD_27245, partial [Candidatus Hodarchaeota archaeon]